MIDALIRKAGNLVRDPVLRRWLAARAFGAASPPPFVPHRPPYLDPDVVRTMPVSVNWPERAAAAPRSPLTLALPGATLTLDPGSTANPFAREYEDRETYLALHRFAWLASADADPDWTDHLWRQWTAASGPERGRWSWHPYTAAERAINLIDHWRRHGVPGPRAASLELLAAHAPAIAERLEYFGEHDTSNHLANNGRGLFALGVHLGVDAWAEAGARILVEEASRLFRPSGVLREGSSHYHLLLTRNYLYAWDLARSADRPEADTLGRIAASALAAAARFDLPGGLPLVGDISPDCPPDALAGLLPSRRGAAVAGLGSFRLEDVAADMSPPDGNAFLDGWGRFASGPWSMLAHASPDGWPPMPGHAHQDLGAFELHWHDVPVFVDPGRGAYGETGDAAWYRSAAAHNLLTVDGHDPYPPNKPYYDAAFRRRIGGPPPETSGDATGAEVRHHGFQRLRGGGAVARRWHFEADALTMADRVEGRGRRTIRRRFVTPLTVRPAPGGVALDSPQGAFALTADAEIRLSTATRWKAYGVGAPVSVIDVIGPGRLPWSGEVRLTAPAGGGGVPA